MAFLCPLDKRFIISVAGIASVGLWHSCVLQTRLWGGLQASSVKAYGIAKSLNKSIVVCVAGKITKCGHVYCWACILHYIDLDDRTWRKCPICFESIHKSDLRR